MHLKKSFASKKCYQKKPWDSSKQDAGGGGRSNWHKCIIVNGITPSSSLRRLSQRGESLNTADSLEVHFIYRNAKNSGFNYAVNKLQPENL